MFQSIGGWLKLAWNDTLTITHTKYQPGLSFSCSQCLIHLNNLAAVEEQTSKCLTVNHLCMNEQNVSNEALCCLGCRQKWKEICRYCLFSEYNDTEQERNEACTAGVYFEQEGEVGEQRKACQFKRSSLSRCSGLSDSTFGYAEGRPCVLLKMNRVPPPFPSCL